MSINKDGVNIQNGFKEEKKSKYGGWDREMGYFVVSKNSQHATVRFVYKFGDEMFFSALSTRLKSNNDYAFI